MTTARRKPQPFKDPPVKIVVDPVSGKPGCWRDVPLAAGWRLVNCPRCGAVPVYIGGEHD